MLPPIIRQHSVLSASMNRSFSGGPPMLTRMWLGEPPPSGPTTTLFRSNAPTIAQRPIASDQAPRVSPTVISSKPAARHRLHTAVRPLAD